jgi:hypothetical protein
LDFHKAVSNDKQLHPLYLQANQLPQPNIQLLSELGAVEFPLVRWKKTIPTVEQLVFDDAPYGWYKGSPTKNQWNKMIDDIFSWLVALDIDPGVLLHFAV